MATHGCTCCPKCGRCTICGCDHFANAEPFQVTNMSEKITIEITPEVDRLLGHLVERGLWGSTKEDVAQQLVLAQLREVVEKGFVGMVGYPDGRTQPLIKER